MHQSLWLKIISKVKANSLELLMNRKRQGKKILKFFLSRSIKALSDLLENTCKMDSGSKKVFCSKQTRMEVIHDHSPRRCADSCSGKWLNCALEVIQENNIYLSSIFQ